VCSDRVESNGPSTISSTLLLEIGTEEIPARFLPDTIVQLEELCTQELRNSLIGFDSIRCFATPRRLSLIVKSLPERQESSISKTFGPPVKIAFDDKGNPTGAATGFARAQGVSVESLRVEKKGKGEYLVAVIEKEGRPVIELLPGILKRIIQSIHFPKSMRWGKGSLRFVRPVRWLLAIIDSQVINLELDGIKSSNKTSGHRFLKPGEREVENADEYLDILHELNVVVDQEKRREIIRNSVLKLAEQCGGKPVEDEELLRHVTYLVEYPTSVLCSFSEDYLRLPKELLITVMRDHQKYFAIQNADSNLVNRFVVISNTRKENADAVRKGAEKVIRARFEDARFYYEDDLKKPLDERIDELKGVTFHDRLGSLYDKSERIQRIATGLSQSGYFEIPGLDIKVQRAAKLSKADLVTGVVKEFPELQGLMGRYYALHYGEDHEVASAIYEHYLPTHAGGDLPSTDTGAVLGIADRIDNIVNFFLLGLKPTGSEDPFALRRQANAIIAILLEKGYRISLGGILDIALREAAIQPSGTSAIEEEIHRFFRQRLENVFISEGYRHDTVQAVISRSETLPLAFLRKIMDSLDEFRKNPLFSETMRVLKRVSNILKETPRGVVDQALLSTEEEKNLFAETSKVIAEIKDFLESEDITSILHSISRLREPVNTFFDNVLVMDRDRAVRNNRLLLLNTINQIPSAFFDVSKLLET
jgi:glycyl-tRNA synthetase beta chain